MSFRQFSKLALRSASRLPTQPAARRTLTSFYRPSTLKQTPRIASLLPTRAAFSTSPTCLQAQEGEVDGELSAKLQQELQMEMEMSSNEEMPINLKDFLESSGFELHDTPGEEEVVLTKTFGGEKIRVSFTIADLDAMDADPDQYTADEALADEDVEGGPASMQQGGAQTKGAINQGRTSGGNINVMPEDRIAPADREGLPEDEQPPEEDMEPSFPARINVTIEKSGDGGAMQFESTATDGQIVIDNVYYYPKKELADAKTAELDWNRRGLYTGPPYGNLDEDLQVLLERYLDERGINTALALWVPEYIDFKEQREYLNWLSQLKSFVDN